MCLDAYLDTLLIWSYVTSCVFSHVVCVRSSATASPLVIYWRCCLQQFSFQRQALAPRLEESTRLALSYLWVVFAFIHNLMRWGGFVNDNSAPRNLNAVDPMSNIARTLLSSLAISIRNTSQMYRLTAACVELLSHLEYVALSLSLVWLLLSWEISTCWPGA